MKKQLIILLAVVSLLALAQSPQRFPGGVIGKYFQKSGSSRDSALVGDGTASKFVKSVNLTSGDIVIDKTTVGLSNVDNTSDVNKPISIATQTALNNKLSISDTTKFRTASNNLYEYKLPSTPAYPETKFLNGNRQWSDISVGNGGYAANLYNSTSASTIVGGYLQLKYVPGATETQLSNTINNQEVLFRSYLYEDTIAVNTIDAGQWNGAFTAMVNNANGITQLKFEPFVRHTNGTETTLFSFYSPEINNTDMQTIRVESAQPLFNVLGTDRLGIRVYGKTTSNSNITITVIIGDGRGGYFAAPLRIRHNQLRNLNSDPNYQHVTTTQITNWNNKQSALGYTPENIANKGVANGYAPLDASAKISTAYLPSVVLGAMKYQGTWDASTATYPASPSQGNYWVVSVAGTISSVNYKVGDWMAYNGASWNKIDNQQTVSSVFGRTGAITAVSGDYTTDQVTEGANKYYTDARSRSALSFTAGSGGYNSTTGVITIPTNNNQLTNGAGYITGNQTITLGGILAGSGSTAISASAAAGYYMPTNSDQLNWNGKISGNQNITLSGDVTGSGATAITTTLSNSGVTAGTYKSVTVDAKGRVTGGTNPTTINGYGITDALPLSSISGGSGFIPKFTSTSTLGNSSLSDNGAAITVTGNNSAPSLKVGTTSLTNAFMSFIVNGKEWQLGNGFNTAEKDFFIYDATTSSKRLRIDPTTGAVNVYSNFTAPSVAITTGAGSNKVLTSDASGNASWGKVIDSGTYMPTLTNITETTALSYVTASYTRIGNNVHVAISGNLTMTASSVCSFHISLPINSANYYGSLTGTAFSETGGGVLPIFGRDIYNNGIDAIIMGDNSSKHFSLSFDYIVQ